MLTITLVVIAASLLLYVIRKLIIINKYWESRGIKHLKPLPFIGNTLPVILNRKHVTEVYEDVLKAFPDEPIVGFYDHVRPVLLVQDPDYIEKVFIKAFPHFMDHGFTSPDEEKQPLDHYQLFSMKGSKWRAYRYKMSPLFTSGKLRGMYEALEIYGEKLIKYMEKQPKTDVSLREVMHLFTMDVVGRAVFGLDAGVIENPESEFHKMGKNVFDISYFQFALLSVFPFIGNMLNISFNNKKSVDYFCRVIKDAFKYRQENGIQRNDFIQMMMQLKEKGKIEIKNWDPNDNYLKTDVNFNPTETFEISDISLISQAYTFMTTGLDAVALTLTYSFYELSRNPVAQDKVREEILEQTKQHSGLTYDALKNMTYLENVVNEVLRLHPLSAAIFRICTKDYTFPNGYGVKKDDVVLIPVLAAHTNPNLHSDPLVFRPERFEFPMKPGTYFPFGDGPRVCIAMRFALLQIKFALANVLTHFKVKLNPRSDGPLRIKPKGLLLEPLQPVYFDLEVI